MNISDINKVLSRTEFQFDHVNELEADLIGLELMSRAGYSPQRGIEMWRRLSETPAEKLNLPVNKTHPPFDKRLSELQKISCNFVASQTSYFNDCAGINS